jgi:hypothetical protein
MMDSPDLTTIIPVIRKSGIAYVNQAAQIHATTVIVSALTEASALMSNAGQFTDEHGQQKAYREATECTRVALDYLSTLIRDTPGNRIQWNSGYSTHQGTITQTMENGQYMVMPDDESPALFMYAHECQIIS